jgi:hypothetical protein
MCRNCGVELEGVVRWLVIVLAALAAMAVLAGCTVLDGLVEGIGSDGQALTDAKVDRVLEAVELVTGALAATGVGGVGVAIAAAVAGALRRRRPLADAAAGAGVQPQFQPTPSESESRALAERAPTQ